MSHELSFVQQPAKLQNQELTEKHWRIGGVPKVFSLSSFYFSNSTREGRMRTTRMKLLAGFIVIMVIAVSFAAVYFQNLRGRANLTYPIRVACIGDSLTDISGYPTRLQDMLGTNYTVRNYGVTASTVLLNTIKPYIDQSTFQWAKDFQPDVVVVMLGSNDAHVTNYLSIGSFVADYEKLLSEIQGLASEPEIFLVKPPPIFDNNLNLSNANLVEGVIPRIEQIAKEEGFMTIDAYAPFVNHPEYFLDGVHLTPEGARILASQIYDAIIHTSELY